MNFFFKSVLFIALLCTHVAHVAIPTAKKIGTISRLIGKTPVAELFYNQCSQLPKPTHTTEALDQKQAEAFLKTFGTKKTPAQGAAKKSTEKAVEIEKIPAIVAVKETLNTKKDARILFTLPELNDSFVFEIEFKQSIAQNTKKTTQRWLEVTIHSSMPTAPMHALNVVKNFIHEDLTWLAYTGGGVLGTLALAGLIAKFTGSTKPDGNKDKPKPITEAERLTKITTIEAERLAKITTIETDLIKALVEMNKKKYSTPDTKIHLHKQAANLKSLQDQLESANIDLVIFSLLQSRDNGKDLEKFLTECCSKLNTKITDQARMMLLPASIVMQDIKGGNPEKSLLTQYARILRTQRFVVMVIHDVDYDRKKLSENELKVIRNLFPPGIIKPENSTYLPMLTPFFCLNMIKQQPRATSMSLITFKAKQKDKDYANLITSSSNLTTSFRKEVSSQNQLYWLGCDNSYITTLNEDTTTPYNEYVIRCFSEFYANLLDNEWFNPLNKQEFYFEFFSKEDKTVMPKKKLETKRLRSIIASDYNDKSEEALNNNNFLRFFEYKISALLNKEKKASNKNVTIIPVDPKTFNMSNYTTPEEGKDLLFVVTFETRTSEIVLMRALDTFAKENKTQVNILIINNNTKKTLFPGSNRDKTDQTKPLIGKEIFNTDNFAPFWYGLKASESTDYLPNFYKFCNTHFNLGIEIEEADAE